MDQEQILSQDSETAGIQQDETQKETTYFADYTLKANELKKAIYLDNRKRGLFKRQMILLILIAVLFAYFGVYQFIVIPEQRLLSVITMAVAGFCAFFSLWFPHQNDKKYVSKVLAVWPRYTVSVSKKCLTICDPEHPEKEKRNFKLSYDERLQVYECSDLFIFVYEKRRLFCLPKKYFDMDEIIEIHELFRERCRSQFAVIDDRTGKEVGHR